MKINRRQFMQVATQQPLSLEALANSGVSHEVKTAFQRADRNRDGFIDGAKECKKLFKNLNKLEKRQGDDRDKRNLNTSASRNTSSVWNLMVSNALTASPPPPPSGTSTHVGGTSNVNNSREMNALLNKMVRTAGTANAEDVMLVKEQLRKLPFDVLNDFYNDGGKVRVCRESVTEHLTQLAGVHPRGWPADKTWDDVEGTYWDATKEVVIATQELDLSIGDETIRVLGQDHGSENLVIHEFAHGYDRLTFRDNRAYRDFERAYDKDDDNMNSPYLTQPGLSGREEAFAECFAYYFDEPSKLDNLPHIKEFFEANFPR